VVFVVEAVDRVVLRVVEELLELGFVVRVVLVVFVVLDCGE
jgi:hypothetical protein